MSATLKLTHKTIGVEVRRCAADAAITWSAAVPIDVHQKAPW
jgi:hypothetical protein